MTLRRNRTKIRLRKLLEISKRSALVALLSGGILAGSSAGQTNKDGGSYPPLPTQSKPEALKPHSAVGMLGIKTNLKTKKQQSGVAIAIVPKAAEPTRLKPVNEVITAGGPSPVVSSEPLFDIDIPIPGVAPESPVTPTPSRSVPHVAILPSTNVDAAPEFHLSDDSAQPATTPPPALSPSEASRPVRARSQSEYTLPPAVTAVAVPSYSLPEEESSVAVKEPVVKDSLSDKQPTVAKDEMQFRLSDNIDAPPAGPQQPKPLPRSIVNRSSKSMRVRIEGLPASPAQPTATPVAMAPLPTFERQPAAVSPRRVPAQLASSVTAARPLPSTAGRKTVAGDPVKVDLKAPSAMSVGDRIVECASEHANVCSVVRKGDHAVLLVGLKAGETRIALVTEGADGKQTVTTHDVQIESSDVSSLSKTQLMASDLTRTVAQMYPGSRVEVVSNGNEFVVQGIVQAESQARHILSLVRKTTLTPVVDRLQSVSH